MTLRLIKRALLSVSDKSGLVDLAKVLQSFAVELISTGGTRKALVDAGLAVRDIAEVTGFPEILDGRVKTLHPRVYGGILARRDDQQHQATLQAHGIDAIDMIVCNLYPFEATVARSGSTHEDIIENIDIGGPTMVRAAAKNYHDVAIVTSPEQYQEVIEELRARDGALELATRERLAAAAFARTAAYDAAIMSYFADRTSATAELPPRLLLHFERSRQLRYGENPHQKAAFYIDPTCNRPCVATARVLHGKELSYNNILDLDSALKLVSEFAEPAAAMIKHNNPCGAAIATSLADAFAKAYEADPLSAFGGILAFNREVDEPTARLLTEPNRFIECIIAPSFSQPAFDLITTRPTWKKSVRLLETGPLQFGESSKSLSEKGSDPLSMTGSSSHSGEDTAGWARGLTPFRTDSKQPLDFRRVDGGLLVQTPDVAGDEFAGMRIVTRRPPSPEELTDLQFACKVCKHVKSNAIVLAKSGMAVGIGAGQMSRVDSVHLAVRKSGERCRGSVLASDAFFPFRDNIDEAAKAGITALVQPGGSVRDDDSIKACDEHGLAMIMTGIRHFRH